MPQPSQLGRNIGRLVAERNWTLKDLSRRADVEYSTLHNLVVTGNQQSIRSDRLQKIAGALGVSSKELLGEQIAPDAEPVDLSQPPLELLRAVGWSDAQLTELAESWARQPEAFRLQAIRAAERMHEEKRQAVHTLLGERD